MSKVEEPLLRVRISFSTSVHPSRSRKPLLPAAAAVLSFCQPVGAQGTNSIQTGGSAARLLRICALALSSSANRCNVNTSRKERRRFIDSLITHRRWVKRTMGRGRRSRCGVCFVPIFLIQYKSGGMFFTRKLFRINIDIFNLNTHKRTRNTRINLTAMTNIIFLQTNINFNSIWRGCQNIFYLNIKK